MEPIKCLNPKCNNVFTPSRKDNVYCCVKCGKQAWNDTHNKNRGYKPKKERLEEAAKKRRKKAWDDINAFIKRNKAETGQYLTYGKAVLLMEKERENNESET